MGTLRSLRFLVAIRPSLGSHPCRTWIRPAPRSTSAIWRANSSPRRRPAYMAVAHSALSLSRPKRAAPGRRTGEQAAPAPTRANGPRAGCSVPAATAYEHRARMRDQLFGGGGEVEPSATVKPSTSLSGDDGAAMTSVLALLNMNTW